MEWLVTSSTRGLNIFYIELKEFTTVILVGLEGVQDVNPPG